MDYNIKSPKNLYELENLGTSSLVFLLALKKADVPNFFVARVITPMKSTYTQLVADVVSKSKHVISSKGAT